MTDPVRRPHRRALIGCALLLLSACGKGSSDSAPTETPPESQCPACVTDSDCPGAICAQFAGDSYCAPDCSQKPCAADRQCLARTSVQGAAVMVCVPKTDICGDDPGQDGGGGGAAGAAGQGAGGGGQSTGPCGALDDPDTASCCHGCGTKPCQLNGCFGGWYCNRDTCRCQLAPDPSSCPDAGSSGSAGAGGSGNPPPSPSPIGPNGGTLERLSFAIVGDTRPPVIDDTQGYPSNVIGRIWQDVQNESPHPPFAVCTGDYVFARPDGKESAPQFDLYLKARSVYQGPVFYALGNHECTSATNSNCGAGNASGSPVNYRMFLSKMLGPLQKTLPYYDILINSKDHSWSAKFLIVAGNAWDAQQASWFESSLAKPSTYTFIVRHEPHGATTAPGVPPTEEILKHYPYTLLVAGHTHTVAYNAGRKELIIGNGGAPLTGAVNYGYAIATQRPDNAIQITVYDYATRAVIQSLAVQPDGTPASR